MDDLLDSTLDDLEDLPEFKPFPVGAHRCLASLEVKEINGNAATELSLKAIETVELANASDEPVKEGDETSVLYMHNNEYGRGNLKKILASLADTIGSRNNREIIEGTKDVEVVVISSLRKDKNDDTKFHMNVKELQVV